MRIVLPPLLRRHFALVHFALLAVAALLSARAATALCALALADVPAVLPSPSSGHTRDGPERSFDIATGAALFDVSSPGTDHGARATSCEEADDTTLPLRLVGASVFTEPSLSLASIVVDERRGVQAEIYAPGDTIEPHAVLVAVARDHACVENLHSGALERVASAAGVEPRPATPATPLPGPTGDQLLDALATGAHVVPRFENGRLIGVKLFSIKPGSLYAAAGLHNGDTVVAINGRTVDNPTQALALWSELRGERSVEVSLLRRGAPVTLAVALPP